MSKKVRQYIGILSAVIAYYIIHEGAHLLYALYLGVFKQINFIGLGIQVDIYASQLTDIEMAVFCILGSIATLISAYILIISIDKIRTVSSLVIKAAFYYITMMMLFADPMYLGILFGFVGGGDMNGITLVINESIARVIFIAVLVINVALFLKVVLPKYRSMFESEKML